MLCIHNVFRFWEWKKPWGWCVLTILSACKWFWVIADILPFALTGRGNKKTHTTCCEVPEGHHWCLSRWDPGQEEPEAWGAQGSERTGHQVSAYYFSELSTWRPGCKLCSCCCKICKRGSPPPTKKMDFWKNWGFKIGQCVLNLLKWDTWSFTYVRKRCILYLFISSFNWDLVHFCAWEVMGAFCKRHF